MEENPGARTINHIVDPTYTVHADFNQGNELMFGMNAGKQCVAMSLCAIVYKEIKSVNIWDKLMLNSILISGNSLYSMISQSINKSYLLLMSQSMWTLTTVLSICNIVISFQGHFV